jgi:pimeloyl-ACP methyl ester carboxylesterase
VKETIYNFGPEQQLVGIACKPSTRPKPITFVFLNAGVISRMGPNRSYVILARSLAAEGYSSFRFDLPGIGDSGLLDESKTIEENNSDAISQALDVLKAQSMSESILLIGLCRGASEALRYAPADTRVRGLVLIDPPELVRTPGWYLRKVLFLPIRPAVWFRALKGRYQLWGRVHSGVARWTRGQETGIPAEVAYRDTWQRIADRQLDCLMLITSGHEAIYSYRQQLFRAFPRLGLKEHVESRMLPDVDHTLSTAAARNSVLSLIIKWAKSSSSVQPDASQESYPEHRLESDTGISES